ncbi:hypothetical protein CCP3SC1AL1_1190016 [Gammaproteobacteria bacterium]
MKLKWIDYQNGKHEVHLCGCSHSKKLCFYLETHEIETQAIGLNELCREIALDFNSDFARDNGMTASEYIDSGEGYPVGRNVGEGVRIMPCIKF